jgi:4-hydroxy-tetrahydrodipicolinate synthase
MLEFFLRAAEPVDLPMYLYNFPELTGNRIDLETVEAFADRAKMAGIKQSGAEFAYHKPLIQLGREKNFSVFSGSDTRLPEVFALGAAGAIGGLVNFVPEMMVQIYNAYREGCLDTANEAQKRMVQTGVVVNRLNFPLNVAAGLEARGFDPGDPKTVVSPRSQGIYIAMVHEFRQLFSQWRLPLH